MLQPGIPIAILGGGISGITAAVILQKNGFEPVIFEKSENLGGVWSVSYPGIRLQNIYQQYHLSNFPWPFKPDLHPSGSQILQYWKEVVRHFHLDIRLGHQVNALDEQTNGWIVNYTNKTGCHQEFFKYTIIAVGQYKEGKNKPSFPGEELFGGQIITERDVHSLDIFKGKRVAVVGFGKSALDMSTFAVAYSQAVHHVFRTPRWTIPEWIMGVHFSHILFSRLGSVMMTSWAHPSPIERFLHDKLKGGVTKFWNMLSNIFQWQITRIGKNKDTIAQERLKQVIPSHNFLLDFRSASALAPETYYPFVAEGKIQPHRNEVKGFSSGKLLLKDGHQIICDLVVLSLGSRPPKFPFLPDKYRQFLESESDGTQLYRHLIHPRIPNLGFAGSNHGFLHIASVEIGIQWLCAYWRGEIKLPSIEEMERSMKIVRDWKRTNIHYEPSRLQATSTRYQQYNDILLKDMGLSPYQKLPNIFAEIFGRYGTADYADIFDKYNKKSVYKDIQLKPLKLDT